MTRTDDDVKRRGGLLKRKGAGVTNLGAARQVVGRLFVGGLSAWTGVVSVIGLGCAVVVGFVWLISELILGDPLVALFYLCLPFAVVAIPLGVVGLVGLMAGFTARRRSGDKWYRKRNSTVTVLNAVSVIHVMCWSMVALVAHVLADEMLGP